MKTFQPKLKDVKRETHVLDARGKVLGRLATEVARYLIGKHKTGYAPHMDMGDMVIVKNALEVAVTGNKEQGKLYRRHSGFPGGFREQTLAEMRKKYPERIIELAVKGMLPKNRLQDKRMRRLKVYRGENK
ncbi:50S ribosomal protein L13 [Candidatus Microgenomates bacterium]|nr:MAG: 50S ribosomal protein L13 [Candidatus Microgenomates bacterium]